MELSDYEKMLLRLCFEARIKAIHNNSWERAVKAAAIADYKPLWVKLDLGEWLW